MKRLLLLLLACFSLLISCELDTTISDEITTDYLLDGDLDVYIPNNQIFRLTGKPGITEVAIGSVDLSKYEPCFVLYVTTGTTQETTVSSAIVKLDNLEVLNTSDFSKNGGQYTFEICNLTETSKLYIEVRGQPDSYINVWIEGKLKPVPPPITGTFVDDRDGHEYKWVQIGGQKNGNQIWMAENLAYLPSVNPCQPSEYSTTEIKYYVHGYLGSDVDAAKETDNYQTYGVLYNWPAIMQGEESSDLNPSGVQGVCPDGWHVPSFAEYFQLALYIDCTYSIDEYGQWYFNNVGNNLKTTSGWRNEGNGIDNYGFSALPAGVLTGQQLVALGSLGGFWCSDLWGTEFGKKVLLFFNDSGFLGNGDMSGHTWSCRCVKDPD